MLVTNPCQGGVSQNLKTENFSEQDMIIRIMGKKDKIIMYNGINRSIGEIKGSNEDFGKVILKENLKRMKKNSKECSEYEFITKSKVK